MVGDLLLRDAGVFAGPPEPRAQVSHDSRGFCGAVALSRRGGALGRRAVHHFGRSCAALLSGLDADVNLADVRPEPVQASRSVGLEVEDGDVVVPGEAQDVPELTSVVDGPVRGPADHKVNLGQLEPRPLVAQDVQRAAPHPLAGCAPERVGVRVVLLDLRLHEEDVARHVLDFSSDPRPDNADNAWLRHPGMIFLEDDLVFGRADLEREVFARCTANAKRVAQAPQAPRDVKRDLPDLVRRLPCPDPRVVHARHVHPRWEANCSSAG